MSLTVSRAFTKPRPIRVIDIPVLARLARSDLQWCRSLWDAGGHVLGLHRDPAAAISAAQSAESKARTAVYLLFDTGGVPPTSPLMPAKARLEELAPSLPFEVTVMP